MPSQSFVNRAMAIAASENIMEDVATAIEMGADPTFVDEHGMTAAMYFADYGNVDGVVMVYNLAVEKRGTPGMGYHSSASQPLQLNKHKVSPVILFARRGDVDAVLKLAAMEPKVLEQPVMNNLQPMTGITIEKVVALLEAGFVTDDKFAVNMMAFGITTSQLLARMGKKLAA